MDRTNEPPSPKPQIPPRRGHRLVLLFATGLVLLGLVFLVRSILGSSRPTPARTAPAVAAHSATFAAPSGNARVPAAAPTAVRPPATPGIDVPVCGHGVQRFAVSRTELRQTLAEYAQRLVAPRESAWIRELHDSADLRARAAGLLLSGHESGSTTVTSASGEDRDALIQLAVGSKDPVLYGIAYETCREAARDPGWKPSGTECQRVTADSWAHLDPHNAVPWLLEAEAAQRRGDATAAAEAIRQAAVAEHFDSYTLELLQAIAPLIPKNLPPLEHTAFEMDMSGTLEMLAPSPYVPMLRACLETSAGAPTPNPTCEAFAQLLLARGKSLPDFLIAVRLGVHAGWSPSTLANLKAERDALLSPKPIDPDQSATCAQLKHLESIFADFVQGGSLGAARSYAHDAGPGPVSPTAAAMGEQFADLMESSARRPLVPQQSTH